MSDSLDLYNRIREIFNWCTIEEQQVLLQILRELSETGQSKTYEDVWLADYKEIPVGIETFISHPRFLGNVTRNGEAIYPFWRKTLKEIFETDQYWEIIFTGATRIGKTSTAITGAAYMLYRMMCLKDPQKYFGKKEISKFSLLFFNLTKDLAKGVAFRELQDTLAASPWFMEHGKKSRSDENFYYIPEGGKVVLNYGSSSSHALGQQVFCLTGNTQILTTDGYETLENLQNKNVDILQIDDNKNSYKSDLCKSNASIILTKYTSETVIITLEDETVIEGTPEHTILLSNGIYRQLSQLTFGDILYTITGKEIKITSIINYKHRKPIPVYDVINAEPYHNFIIRGNTTGIVSHNCAVCDETNFLRAGVKDISKAKADMMDLYNTVLTRVQGTFRQNGKVYGKVFAVSSKNSDSDFLESYIERQTSAGATENLYIVDKPQWEVQPASMFRKEKFKIAVGDRYHKGFVIPDNQTDEKSINDLTTMGYKILDVPVDMKNTFLSDFDIALRDVAGISVPGALSFISQSTIDDCINTERRNPFYTDIISIGTKDDLTIEEFFHIDEIKYQYRQYPMFIHHDLSLNTDRTGISGIIVSGRKDVKTEDGKLSSVPVFTHVFSIAIEAPRGDNIAYNKVLNFDLWLKKQGFNIVSASRDQFQSEYLGQLLEQNGIPSPKISLDRTPDGYITLRSVLLENRVDMLDCKLLQDELIHLQRDSVTGRIDHTISGSKDISDSFAGAIWQATLDNPPAKLDATHAISAIAAVNGRRGSYRGIPQNTGFVNRYR